MKRLRLILLIVVAAFAAVYAGDYVSLRFRSEQYGSVMVRRTYEVTLKSRKTEYMSEEPAPQQCVHSLFPHFGCSACWWLERHPKQVVKVNPGNQGGDFWKIP